MTDEEQLAGGIANAGKVTKVGDEVRRPSNPFSPAVHRFLGAIRDAGFAGASRPIGIGTDGRERLEFIAGDVPLPPYPAWAQAEAALGSIADLMRRFHRASAAFDPSGETWSDEMTDPAGGPIICHNDVCLENVVFRDGVAVGLLDFDFAAPGRPLYDLAAMVRMCVPIDDDDHAARFGWTPADRPARVRLVADRYGLDAAGRHDLLGHLDDSIARSGEFVRRRVEAGDPNFIEMWEENGGASRHDFRRGWWTRERPAFTRALS